MLYGALSARENVEFSAKLFGMHNPREAAKQALERMERPDRSDTPVRR